MERKDSAARAGTRLSQVQDVAGGEEWEGNSGKERESPILSRACWHKQNNNKEREPKQSSPR